MIHAVLLARGAPPHSLSLSLPALSHYSDKSLAFESVIIHFARAMRCARAMRFLLLLAFLPTASSLPTSKVVVKFTTNGTEAVTTPVDLYDLFETAQTENVAVELFRQCESPVKFYFTKCDRTIIRADSALHNGSHLFQDEWIRYFLDVTTVDCDNNVTDVPMPIILRAISLEPADCKYIFRLAPRKLQLKKSKNEQTTHDIENTGAFILPYKVSLPLYELQQPRRALKMTSHFREAATFRLGKCGLIVPWKVNPTFDKPYQIDEVVRLTKLTCTFDQTSSFDVYINSVRGNNGTFSFTIVEVPNHQVLGIVIVLLVVIMVSGIVFLAVLAVRQCCLAVKDPKNNFDTDHSESDSWLEMSDMNTESIDADD